MNRFRYFEERHPAKDEPVIADVTRVGKMGYDLRLCEYDDYPAFMPVNELSRNRRQLRKGLHTVLNSHSKKKLFKVLRVNEATDPPTIDLTLRYCDQSDVDRHKVLTFWGKKFLNFGRDLYTLQATIEGIKKPDPELMEEICRHSIWKFSKRDLTAAEFEARYQQLLDSPEVLVADPYFTPEFRRLFLASIPERRKMRLGKIIQPLSVTSLDYDGRRRIVDALDLASKELADRLSSAPESSKTELLMDTPPVYHLIHTTPDLAEGEKLVLDLLKIIEQRTEGMIVDLSMAPKLSKPAIESISGLSRKFCQRLLEAAAEDETTEVADAAAALAD